MKIYLFCCGLLMVRPVPYCMHSHERFTPTPMVFYTHVIALRQRNRHATATFMKEIATQVYSGKGVLRGFSNEGIMRPYKKFRDTQNASHLYSRYLVMQIDVSEDVNAQLAKRLREHVDVLTSMSYKAEHLQGLTRMEGYFPLDTFTRKEEELRWSPQVSGDVYDQLDANWKEFSRTRWSEFLRS